MAKRGLAAAAVVIALSAGGYMSYGMLRDTNGGCVGGQTDPLERRAVLRALRLHHFAARTELSGAFCTGADPRIAYAITNAPTDSSRYSQVQDRSGIVNCALYAHPVYPTRLRANLHERSYGFANGRKAHFWFGNVDCVLHAGDVRQDLQVSRLAGAMRQLAAP
jgi:hypothetical protein